MPRVAGSDGLRERKSETGKKEFRIGFQGVYVRCGKPTAWDREPRGRLILSGLRSRSYYVTIAN